MSENKVSVIIESLKADILDGKYALKTTDRKIVVIGRSCGFRNPDYLKRLFRKRFGMSMREWRATHRKTNKQ